MSLCLLSVVVLPLFSQFSEVLNCGVLAPCIQNLVSNRSYYSNRMQVAKLVQTQAGLLKSGEGLQSILKPVAARVLKDLTPVADESAAVATPSEPTAPVATEDAPTASTVVVASSDPPVSFSPFTPIDPEAEAENASYVLSGDDHPEDTAIQGDAMAQVADDAEETAGDDAAEDAPAAEEAQQSEAESNEDPEAEPDDADDATSIDVHDADAIQADDANPPDADADESADDDANALEFGTADVGESTELGAADVAPHAVDPNADDDEPTHDAADADKQLEAEDDTDAAEGNNDEQPDAASRSDDKDTSAEVDDNPSHGSEEGQEVAKADETPQ
jgi:hypothetical protein